MQNHVDVKKLEGVSQGQSNTLLKLTEEVASLKNRIMSLEIEVKFLKDELRKKTS